MTELEIVKMSLNFANHTIKQLEERIKRRNLIIAELKEKLREVRNDNKLWKNKEYDSGGEFLSFIPTVLENVHYTGADAGYYETAEETLEKGLQWLQSESE